MPLKGWATEFEDIIPNSPAGVCGSACCFIVNFILIILFFPCTVTQLGQFKLGLIKNKVTGYVDLDTSYEPGRYWIGFWKEFIEFPSTLQTIEFSEEKPEEGVQHLSVLRSRDKDGKQILLDISIQYRLSPKNIGKIYKDMLIGYEDIYISELRDVLAKAANSFPIQDAWDDYQSIVDKMTVKCEEVLAQRYAQCWSLQLWGVTLTTKYEAKLILTQVRKQAMKTEMAKKTQAEVRAKTQVLLAEYKKNVTIIKSAGDADRYVIERRAYATAQANIVAAQAQSLQIVRDRVCPDYARGGSASGLKNESFASCNAPGWVMDSKQLVEYQKMTLLKHHNASHFIYNLRGGARPEARNVVASRNIMNGKVRRLLQRQQEPEREL